MRGARAAGALQPGLAAVIRSKLGFALSSAFSRVGRAATGGAPSWLQSNWSLGRFAGGPGGGQVRPPSVIRVGQAFQAVVPPWRGPVSLDGAGAETTEHRTPASGAKTRDASLAPPSRAKKSTRVEARAEREAEAEREALERRERADCMEAPHSQLQPMLRIRNPALAAGP